MLKLMLGSHRTDRIFRIVYLEVLRVKEELKAQLVKIEKQLINQKISKKYKTIIKIQ